MNLKKILALVLVLAMLVSMVPTYAFAEDVELWDEEEVAVQDDAALEDVYLDEEPEEVIVEDEPEATEPEAVEVEEPAAEPVAEEPAAVEGLVAEETNALEAVAENDIAKIGGIGYASLSLAVAAATDDQQIDLLKTTDEDVTVNHNIWIVGNTVEYKGTITVAADVTLNLKCTGPVSVLVNSGTLSIADGSYTVVKANGVTSGNVTGGTFTALDTALLADGYVPTNYDGSESLGKSVVVTEGNKLVHRDFVAERVDANGNRDFFTTDTFANAFNRAGTVTLLDNVSLSTGIRVAYNTVLDLNGHTVTDAVGFSGTDVDYLFVVRRGGTLTINDTVGTGAITTTNNKVVVAVKVTEKGEDTTGENATLIVNGGTIQGYNFAISGNGTRHNTSITINNGTFRGYAANDNLAIYHPQTGTLTIKGGTFTGYNSAIEMRAGTLNISDGTFTATAKTLVATGNGNGNTVTGAAIAVSQHTTEKAITVNISGGTFNGMRAVYEKDVQTPATGAAVSITITDGTFNTTDTAANAKAIEFVDVDNSSESVTATISGGTYKTAVPEAYCAEDFVPVQNEDGTYGVAEGEYVVRVVKKGTDTSKAPGYVQDDFAKAVEAAKTGFNATLDNSLYLKVLSGEQTATFSYGDKIRVVADKDSKFIPVLADSVNTYFVFKGDNDQVITGTDGKPVDYTNVTIPNDTRVTIIVEKYAARVSGADPELYKNTAEDWSAAVVAAKTTQGAVLTPLVENKALTMIPGESININDSEITVAVSLRTGYSAAQYHIFKHEATGYTTYKCAEIVASYQKDNTEEFTETFVAAATEAAKNPDDDGVFSVKLYKTPVLTGDNADIYTIASGTLNVVATGTDILTTNNYKKIVVVEGEKVLTSTFKAADKTATYTVSSAIARIDYNGVAPAYFNNISSAINAAKGHENLVITLLDNVPTTVLNKNIATQDPETPQVFNINDNGFTIDLKAPANKLDNNKKLEEAYELVKTPSESANYTTYELKPATVYVLTDDYDLDKNFDKIPGSNFKGYADFADAAKAAAGTQTIVLLKNTAYSANAPYILGSDPTVTKVIVDPKGSNATAYTLTIKAAEGLALKTDANTPSAGLTTYSVGTPVASITAANGTITTYQTFAEAAAKGLSAANAAPTVTIKLLATDETEYALALDKSLKINEGTFKVNIVPAAVPAANPNAHYSILKTPNEDGTVTYKCVASVASIDFGAEAGGVKYYATFAEAAKLAYVTGDAEPTLTVNILSTVQTGDKFAVTEKGTLKLSGTVANVTSSNFTLTGKIGYTDKISGTGTNTIKTVSIIEPVASVDFGTATTPDVRYYGTFADAAAAAVTPGKNVVILAEIAATDTYALAQWGTLKVETNNFEVTVTAAGNVNNTDWAYAIDKSTADGVTTFKSVSAVASVDLGTETAHDVHYYATFADAAKAAAGTKRITLLKTFTQQNPGQTARKVEYALGATDAAEQIIVDLYGNTLTVTSAVDGKSVNMTSERDTTLNRMINTYKLNNPAAYVMDGETNLGYFDTFAQAAAKALVNADAAQNTKKVVLMANVEADYKLPVDKQINIETGDYTVNVVPTHKTDSSTTPATVTYYAVDWSLNDGVYNFKSVPAVASIDYSQVSLKTGDVEYYATFAEAAQHAYFFGEDKPTLTVVVYRQPAVADPDNPTVIADLFEVSEAGSILIDKSAETSTNKINVEPNFDMADGLAYDYEFKGNGVYLVKIVEAEAYTSTNSGEIVSYVNVEDACDVSKNNPSHPVVFLLKDGLTYALASGATIRVDKNGHDDFVVTKTSPDQVSPAYVIVETVNGGVSTYTTDYNTSTKVPAAYINFETTKEDPNSDYGTITTNVIVYYGTFAEAAEAANGEETIVLNRGMTAKEQYVLAADETLIISVTNSNYNAEIAAPDGYALKDTPTTGTNVHTYTVEACVATVNYKFDPDEDAYDKPYADLADAIADAIKYYDGGALLTLTAPVAADFTYPLVEKDYLKVVADDDYKFEQKNFIVPDGFFASLNEDTTSGWIYIIPAQIMASIGEGDDIQYFSTFKAAVDAAVQIEKDAGHYGDEFNPSTVITLYADNTVPLELKISAAAGKVKTLILKAGEFDTGLSIGSGNEYFLEKIPTEQEGVFKYQKSKLVATVESGPINARVTTKYSSFAAAAEAALNTVEMVKLNVAQADLEADDIFEMPAGTLRVYLDSHVTSFAELQADHIKVKGEKLFINSEWITDGHYQLFTVTGAVASITTPQGTAFYYDMAQAIAAAKNHANMVIVPLTDIDCYLPASAGINGDYFNVADSEYDVRIRAAGFELAHEGTKYTFKSAVAYVTTEDVLSVDPATNEPTFIDQYFSDIADAIEFAEGKMLITLLQDVEYEFHDASTVAIIALTTEDATGGTATHKFNRTVSDKLEGYAIKDTVIKEADPRTAKYEVAALQTVTLNAGNGTWGTAPNTRNTLTGVALAGANIKELMTNDVVPANRTHVFYTEPKLTGYKPAYWVDDEGNKYLWTWEDVITDADKAAGYKGFPIEMPENGLNLTAVWEGNKYWIDYDSVIGTTVARIGSTKLTYGELLEVPENYDVIEHYDFVGWFTASTCKPSEAFDIANTKITADLELIDHVENPATHDAWQSPEGYMTLYAKFVPKTYTVSFVTDCDITLPDQRVTYGTAADFSNTGILSREGYKPFGNKWQYKDEEGTLKDWVNTWTVVEDLVLYAKWEAIPMTVLWADGDTVLAVYDDHTETNPKYVVGAEITPPTVDSENKPIAKREKAGFRLNTENMWADFDGKIPYNEKQTIIYQLNWIEQIPVTFIDGGKKLGQISVDKDSHLADAKDVPAPTKEGYTLVWQLEGEDYDLNAPIQEELILTASWVEGEDVSEYATVVSSLSLNNNINLNAYVTIKENTVPGDYEVKVEFNGNTMMEGTLDTVGTYVEYSGEYRLADIAVIAAPQMNDAATVTITYQGQEVLSKDLSVRAYAEEWIEKSDDDELAEMLKSLLDFGAYSQILFNYETDNLVNSKYSTGKVPTTTVPVYNITKDGSVTGINGVSPSLTLVSNTSLNMYFSVAKKNSKIAFSVDGKAAPASYKAKEYRVEKAGINIVNLDKEIVYTATLGDETFTVSAAPLAYAYMHQNDGDGLGEVCKAVYQYYLAAVEYFS